MVVDDRWMRARTYALVLFAASLGACKREAPRQVWAADDHAQPAAAQVDPARMAVEVAPADGGPQHLAMALWQSRCSMCHGAAGRGDGVAKPPGAQLANFADSAWQSQRSDAQLAEVIEHGRGLMPAFGGQLQPPAIAALVALIRSFAQ